MRRVAVTMMAIGVLASGWATVPARADDHTAYYAGCMKQSGNKQLCGCLADQAMKIDAQLRADMILSMSDPGAYRARRANKLPKQELAQWEQFDDVAHKACGMDI